MLNCSCTSLNTDSLAGRLKSTRLGPRLIRSLNDPADLITCPESMFNKNGGQLPVSAQTGKVQCLSNPIQQGNPIVAVQCFGAKWQLNVGPGEMPLCVPWMP